MDVLIIFRRDLYAQILHLKSKNNYNLNTIYKFVKNKLKNPKCVTKEKEIEIKKSVQVFQNEFEKRWQKCFRIKKRFENVYGSWLDETFKVSISDVYNKYSDVGRPKINFSEASTKTKLRRTNALMESVSVDELTFATKISLKRSGQTEASKLLKEATETTPTWAKKIRDIYKKSNTFTVEIYSEEEDLALIVDRKLTKSQYMLIRLNAIHKNANIYPSYSKIIEAKTRCYSEKNSILITEKSAEVKFQALLNHTTCRIFLSIENLLNLNFEHQNFVLLYKWGCDGASGQSQYKQKFDDDDQTVDNHIFFMSIVPIVLYHHPLHNPELKINIWQNPRPSSTKYCRPIRIQFKNETSNLIKEEFDSVSSEINELESTVVLLKNGNSVNVIHKLIMTMIDGKVCNSLADNSSAQKCYVCGVVQKNMNDIDDSIVRATNEMTFEFCLSTLHTWIRFFECLLHVSYRLDFKKWQAKGEHKNLMLQRKKQIQLNFKNKMGLLVDIPKSTGSETSNDGNTARWFFSNPELAASITGIEKEVIVRFSVILQVISSGKPVKNEEFNKYAIDTEKIFVKYYPWYYLPASVHKILILGSKIIEHAIIPIGLMSEKAQESRNKDIKRFREYHDNDGEGIEIDLE